MKKQKTESDILPKRRQSSGVKVQTSTAQLPSNVQENLVNIVKRQMDVSNINELIESLGRKGPNIVSNPSRKGSRRTSDESMTKLKTTAPTKELPQVAAPKKQPTEPLSSLLSKIQQNVNSFTVPPMQQQLSSLHSQLTENFYRQPTATKHAPLHSMNLFGQNPSAFNQMP